jgi:hypothetical protein
VLDYVGPGHWYFVSTVSSLWKDVHERVQRQVMRSYDYKGHYPVYYIYDPQETLSSSIWASSSRVRLAHSTGLNCLKGPRREYLAGRYADQATLVKAHELGLKYTSDVF